MLLAVDVDAANAAAADDDDDVVVVVVDDDDADTEGFGEEVTLLLPLRLPPVAPVAVPDDDGKLVVNAICCFLRNSALFGGGGLAGLFIS